MHGAAAAASSLQVTEVGELVAVKLTAGVVVLTNEPLAGELIVTTGIAATVHVEVAEPELPAGSVDVMTSVWLPVARPL